jgi:trimeric autotransporter adhesin
MSSIGSSTSSFWSQDQSYWNQQQSAESSTSATTALINAMGDAVANEAKGKASIANSEALKRVNSQLVAAIQSVLSGNTTSTGSTTSSSSSSYTAAKPATGTGTAPLTVSTPLSQLGIPAGGSVTVSAGGNTTTYASTGSDTVGDLMSAINKDYYGTAQVTASLNSSGDLVLTSKNTTDEITVNGVYARNLGFGASNDTFKATPAQGTPPSAATSTASTTSSSSSTTTKKSYTTALSESSSSAASLLSDSGAAGSVVDLLA